MLKHKATAPLILLCGFAAAVVLVFLVSALLSEPPSGHPSAKVFEEFLAEQKAHVLMLLAVEAAIGAVLVFLAVRVARRLAMLLPAVDQALAAMSDLTTDTTKYKVNVLEPESISTVAANIANTLAEAKRKENLLLEKAVDVVCVLDLNAKLVSVSKACRRAWGYMPQELIGTPVHKLLDSKSATQVTDLISSGTRTIDKVVFESKMKRKDGTEIDTAWTGHWSLSEGGLFCIVHDISEQKLRERGIRLIEQKLRLTLESLPVGVIATDAMGMIEFANTAAHRLLGCMDGGLLGSSISGIFESNETTKQAREKGIGVDTFARKKDSDGQIPVEMWCSDMDVSDDPKMLFVFLDKSTQVELEKVKREFLAMISHDLRTPLSTVQGFTVLLEKGVLGQLTADGQKLAGSATRECQRMMRLLNDILDLEKLEAGAFALECKQFDLGKTIGEAIESVRPLAAAKGVRIESSLKEYGCLADELRITQVLLNLLSNAIKFSPERGRVLISLSTDMGVGLVAIIDEGRGIPEDKLPRVFEKFEQIQSGDAREKGGTGLGLAICKAIIQQHHGQIGVDSVVGQGSRFWFVLPRNFQ